MSTQPKQLYRSRDRRMISGVCGGLGDYFGIDPTIVRLIFVFGSIFGYGILLLIYIVMMVVVPEEPVVDMPVPSPEPMTTVEPAASVEEEQVKSEPF
jgi:phage shock protein C